MSGQVAVARRVENFAVAHQQREGGGFLVRRPIGGRIRNCDPFLLMDRSRVVQGRRLVAAGTARR